MFPLVKSMEEVGVSIITPPAVSQSVLEEGYKLGVRNFFLQPGTYNEQVDEYIHKEMNSALIVKGCVLVELGFSDH